MDNSESQNLQGDPVIREALPYCDIYLQEHNRVPIVNIGENSLLLFGREKRKGNILKSS